jgi:hypothetical protein
VALSEDPEKRKRQLGNLRPAGAVKHGATSEGKLKPLRAKHRGELLHRFPGLDRQRPDLLSDLLAQIDLAREYLDDRGPMRNTREAHPLLVQLDRWERRSWQMLRELQPTNEAPVDRPEGIIEFSDPEVRKYTRALLKAISTARMRRKGLEVRPHEEPEPLNAITLELPPGANNAPPILASGRARWGPT